VEVRTAGLPLPQISLLEDIIRRFFQTTADTEKPLGRWGYHYDRVKIHQVYYE
jgi:hypothetical protein